MVSLSILYGNVYIIIFCDSLLNADFKHILLIFQELLYFSNECLTYNDLNALSSLFKKDCWHWVMHLEIPFALSKQRAKSTNCNNEISISSLQTLQSSKCKSYRQQSKYRWSQRSKQTDETGGTVFRVIWYSLDRCIWWV